MKKSSLNVFLIAFVVVFLMSILMQFYIKTNQARDNSVGIESALGESRPKIGNEKTEGAPPSIQSAPSVSDHLIPEPPAKQWKCRLHQKLPDGIVVMESNPSDGAINQPEVLALDGNSSFRNQETPIPFAEFEHVIKLDDVNYAFVWAATDKTLPSIDKQHQRIVQSVFGSSDVLGAWHYVFSIRNFKADEITVISIPIPKDMMVEVQGGLQAQAPGWIPIHMRKDGASSPTPAWIHFSIDDG